MKLNDPNSKNDYRRAYREQQEINAKIGAAATAMEADLNLIIAAIDGLPFWSKMRFIKSVVAKYRGLKIMETPDANQDKTREASPSKP